MPNFISPTSMRVDLVDGGFNHIAGTTKNEAGAVDTPVRRRVRMHDQLTGRAVREVWSDATTGAYNFDRIRSGRFYVIGFDHTDQYNGEVQTDVVSEPMP